MIKVTDNGVPLSAIASITIRKMTREDYLEGNLSWLAGALKITEDEARELRRRWLSEWPEVAAFLSKK